MGLIEALGLTRARAVAPKPDDRMAPPNTNAQWPRGAVAQLVGASLITPLNDPGFQLDFHLPKLLDVGPGGEPPKTYKSVTGEGLPRIRFDENLLSDICNSFSFPVSYYGQDTAEGFNLFLWNGVRMKGLPVITGFTAERTDAEVRWLWDHCYLSFGNVSKPAVTVASGNSGWTTLETAWRTIATPESKVIWLSTTDAPSYPADELPNEASVLLMVAHPAYETGRKPLAYFTAPTVVPVKDVQGRDKEAPRIAALRLAVEQACAAAGIAPTAIGTVARDCGRQTPEASKRLAETAAAIHDLLPGYDVVHDGIDLVALLGELGANTVSYTLLLAAYAAWTRNHPVLYVSDRDPDAGRAMLVFPPPGHTPPDPNRKFREGNARGEWYRPWWGQRLDGKKDY